MFFFSKNKIIFFCFIWLNITWLEANDSSVYFQAEVDKKTINIADEIKLTVTLETPAQEKVILPILVDTLGDFTIIDLELVDDEIKGNKKIQKNIYTLTIYQTGEFSLPSLIIQFSKKEKVFTYETSPILITVASLIDNTNELNINEHLFDIDGQIAIWFYLLMVVILFFIVALIFFFYRKSRQKKPFYDFFFKEASKLFEENSLPLDSHKVKSFYFQFYTLVKSFISKKYQDKKLLGFTSKQTLFALYKKKNQDLNFYEDFLNYADKVKFSDFKNNQKKDKYFREFFENILQQEKIENENKAKKIIK